MGSNRTILKLSKCSLGRVRNVRSGFSLLEVILAIAILGIALVAIGQLHNLGYRHASNARLRSEANIMLDAKMAEVVAGVIPLEATTGAIEGSEGWQYEVMLGDSGQTGLLTVTVGVSNGADAGVPISLVATRFVPDPNYDPLEDSFVE